MAAQKCRNTTISSDRSLRIHNPVQLEIQDINLFKSVVTLTQAGEIEFGMKLKGPYRVELLVRDTATGFLMADSVPGERSLFRITLPTQNSSEDKKPMSLFLGEGDFSCLHGKTVLVVDDNPFIHEMVSLHVQDFEIRILKAANGQGVFHLVRNQAPYLNYK